MTTKTKGKVEEAKVELTVEQRIDVLTKELVEVWQITQDLLTKVDNINALLVHLSTTKVVTKGTPKFGSHRDAVKVLNKETGELYNSKSACGKAVAESMGLDATNNFIFYEMVKKAPERFEEQS